MAQGRKNGLLMNSVKAGELAGRRNVADRSGSEHFGREVIFNSRAQLNSYKILREQPTCGLLKRLSKRATLPGSRRSIASSEPLPFATVNPSIGRFDLGNANDVATYCSLIVTESNSSPWRMAFTAS